MKRILFNLFLICSFAGNTFAVCPVPSVVPVKEIENDIKEKLNGNSDKLLLKSTPTGFIISVEQNMMFDNNNCLSCEGCEILNFMAEIMKTSGRRWHIFCHDDSPNLYDALVKTSYQASKITDYLIDIERCLINQISPIGFGSMMPYKNFEVKDGNTNNRIDFIVEDFSFNR